MSAAPRISSVARIEPPVDDNDELMRIAKGAVESMRVVLESSGVPATPTDLARRLEGAAIFNSMKNGAALVALDGQWLSFNDAVCDILDRSPGAIKRLDWPSVTHPDDIKPDEKCVEKLVTGEWEYYHMLKRYLPPGWRNADDDSRWVKLSVTVERYADGKPSHFVVEIVDLGPIHGADLDEIAARRHEGDTSAGIWR